MWRCSYGSGFQSFEILWCPHFQGKRSKKTAFTWGRNHSLLKCQELFTQYIPLLVYFSVSSHRLSFFLSIFSFPSLICILSLYFSAYSFSLILLSKTHEDLGIPFKTFALFFFISVINQLDAQNFCFTISLFHASTCFKHMCSSSGGQNCITQPLVSSHLWVAVSCTCAQYEVFKE